ncbi:MAG TPA: hypothetical protein VF322_03880 [Gammaproteobacteria bacterium]
MTTEDLIRRLQTPNADDLRAASGRSRRLAELMALPKVTEPEPVSFDELDDHAKLAAMRAELAKRGLLP